MVLVRLLDLRYTASLFSITSGKKCSLGPRLRPAERESGGHLPINVELPQSTSEIIGRLTRFQHLGNPENHEDVSYLATEIGELGVGTTFGGDQ